MIVTYTPEDGDVQRWTWVPRKVRTSDAERVERRYGANWSTFVLDSVQGNASARRVLLWHLMLRDHPRLRFEDTPDLLVDELRIDSTLDELVAQRARIAEQTDIGEDTREQVLAALDAQIAAVPEDLVGEGKANVSDAASTI
jgi:hypothetical protein